MGNNQYKYYTVYNSYIFWNIYIRYKTTYKLIDHRLYIISVIQFIKLITFIYSISVIKGMNQNVFPKMIVSQILIEYGRMTSSELKMLVEERMRYEIPQERWNNIVQELTQVTGMIEVEA